MLYTRKGDDGKTRVIKAASGNFGCDQRISKSSAIAEALGSLDETNSYLGVLKMKTSADAGKLKIAGHSFSKIIHQAQENLFIIQAEVAGADKSLDESKVKAVESNIAEIEKELPPIKTFFISGGTEIAAMFDFARTLARRAERRVVAVSEEGLVKVGVHTLAYLNRLSSLLYSLARLSNHFSGINEESPKY